LEESTLCQVARVFVIVCDRDTADMIHGVVVWRFLYVADFSADNCQTVLNFLVNNQYPRPGGKPFFFCSDSWLQRKTIKDFAFDSEGNEFPDSVGSGWPAVIGDVPAYMEARRISLYKTPVSITRLFVAKRC
jgi:hypothetical protein